MKMKIFKRLFSKKKGNKGDKKEINVQEEIKGLEKKAEYLQKRTEHEDKIVRSNLLTNRERSKMALKRKRTLERRLQTSKRKLEQLYDEVNRTNNTAPEVERKSSTSKRQESDPSSEAVNRRTARNSLPCQEKTETEKVIRTPNSSFLEAGYALRLVEKQLHKKNVPCEVIDNNEWTIFCFAKGDHTRAMDQLHETIDGITNKFSTLNMDMSNEEIQELELELQNITRPEFEYDDLNATC